MKSSLRELISAHKRGPDELNRCRDRLRLECRTAEPSIGAAVWEAIRNFDIIETRPVLVKYNVFDRYHPGVDVEFIDALYEECPQWRLREGRNISLDVNYRLDWNRDKLINYFEDHYPLFIFGRLHVFVDVPAATVLKLKFDNVKTVNFITD